MDDLQESLRKQCSFFEIGRWLVENTPIIEVEFARIKRIENIPMDTEGKVMDAWYARESKDLRCGWTADLRWTVLPDAIWASRNLIDALDMFVLTPLTIKDRQRKWVVAQQRATLLAEKFPAMWMAQKLSGKVN